MQKVVNVLLSTYNGSSWLKELLESLAGQKSIEVKLIWRDDGSTDNSVSIVSNFHNIEKIKCEHIKHKVGPAESYLHLMSHLQINQFAAFCDQDDVWELDKLQIQMKELSGISSPSISCSAVRVIDGGEIWPKRIPTFSLENSIFQNSVPGCTYLLNPAAIEIIRKFPKTGSQMHDHWSYVLMSLYGSMIFYSMPLVKYRIHGENDTGIPALHRFNLTKMFLRFKNINRKRRNYAKDTHLLIESIPSNDRPALGILNQIKGGLSGNFSSRIKFVLFGPGIQRSHLGDRLIFNALCLIGFFRI